MPKLSTRVAATAATLATAGALVTAGALGAAPAGAGTPAGEVLPGWSATPGTVLSSPQAQSRLVFQTDGNLVSYSSGGAALWSAGLAGSGATGLLFQGDGNLVAYRADGRPVWSSGTAGRAATKLDVQDTGAVVVSSASAQLWMSSVPVPRVPTGSGVLVAGQGLLAGDKLVSPNGQYTALQQADGNLVEYGPTGALWSSHTAGRGVAALTELQSDGNLVMYGGGHAVAWSTGTSGTQPASLRMQDDGNLALYAVIGPVWSSKTGRIAPPAPIGAFEAGAATSAGTIHVQGWAAQPGYLTRTIGVYADVDGARAAVSTTNVSRPDIAASQHTGPTPGYSFSIATSAGSHMVCLWGANIAAGSDGFLGCAAISTPAVAVGTGPVKIPAANLVVMADAAKHLGLPYVWGGESPVTGFDCSGLVQYSYRVAKVSVPRVSQDQFRAARIIPASRAVAGDLVFYHDNTGSVYHVGIYTKPGSSYAAVDPAEGVRIQQIWDSTATYGSFTHS